MAVRFSVEASNVESCPTYPALTSPTIGALKDGLLEPRQGIRAAIEFETQRPEQLQY